MTFSNKKRETPKKARGKRKKKQIRKTKKARISTKKNKDWKVRGVVKFAVNFWWRKLSVHPIRLKLYGVKGAFHSIMGASQKERRRRRAEKRLSKRVFLGESVSSLLP